MLSIVPRRLASIPGYKILPLLLALLTGCSDNHPADISGSPQTQVMVGTQYVFQPSASDSDGDQLAFSVYDAPTWLQIDPSSGMLTGTPTIADVGTTAPITVAVSDGKSESTLSAFSIKVLATASAAPPPAPSNSVPTISGSPAASVTVGGRYDFQPAAADQNGDSLAFSIQGKPAWATFDTATGHLGGTPSSGDVGTTANVVIQVSDGVAQAMLPAFSIQVVAVSTAPTGSIGFATATYSVVQSAGVATVTINRSGGSSGAASVNYATVNGTAIAGSNYTAKTGTLNWTSGDTAAKTVSIVVSNATLFSGSKTFSIGLSNVTGASMSVATTAAVTISGSAVVSAGTVSVGSVSYAVSQAAGTIAVIVNRSGGTSGVASVNYLTSDGTAIAGSHYTATNGKLTWADGDAVAKSISIPISAAPYTGTKSFSVALSNATGATQGTPAATTVTVSGIAVPAPTVTLSTSQTSVASGGTVTLTWSSTNATSCTASGTWSGTKTATGSSTTSALTAASTFTLSCTGIGGSASASKTVTITSTAAGGTCLGTDGVNWVYYNGAMSPNWPYDYSWSGLQVEYSDATGNPLTPPYDIKATGVVYAGWQPASLNWSFDVTGCNYLTFALKPTVANQKWAIAFLYVGDIDTNIAIGTASNATYGPINPVVGQWNVYKIPLTAFFPGGVVPPNIYKFHIQDQTGNGGANNVWYIDNVGFTAN
jgi:Calx-beta domain/Putative Ig domain